MHVIGSWFCAGSLMSPLSKVPLCFPVEDWNSVKMYLYLRSTIFILSRFIDFSSNLFMTHLTGQVPCIGAVSYRMQVLARAFSIAGITASHFNVTLPSLYVSLLRCWFIWREDVLLISIHYLFSSAKCLCVAVDGSGICIGPWIWPEESGVCMHQALHFSRRKSNKVGTCWHVCARERPITDVSLVFFCLCFAWSIGAFWEFLWIFIIQQTWSIWSLPFVQLPLGLIDFIVACREIFLITLYCGK